MRSWAPWLLLLGGAGAVILGAALGLAILIGVGGLSMVASLVVAVFDDH